MGGVESPLTSLLDQSDIYSTLTRSILAESSEKIASNAEKYGILLDSVSRWSRSVVVRILETGFLPSLSGVPYTITRLVKTVVPPHRLGGMRVACSKGIPPPTVVRASPSL